MRSSLMMAVAASLIVAGCNGREATTGRATDPLVDPQHQQEVREWQERRQAGLRKDDSWLTLVGLHWLEPGENRFGSGAGTEVTLPEGKAPEVAGSLILKDGKITLDPVPGAGIMVDGRPAQRMDLKPDSAEDGPTEMRIGSVLFYPIKRGDRYGIRVKDSESDLRRNFKGLDYYPIDAKWRFDARFEPYPEPKTMKIANIVGQVEDTPSPGQLVFTVDGKDYRLDPIDEGDDFFVIFRDETAGEETYGAGRYIYTKKPENGRVVLDFNRAYNPPCVFSPYATCPLPPPQNILPLRITAGEKMFEAGD